MKRENLYEPFEVAFSKLDEGPGAGHRHLFFELVYIMSGTGKQCINKSTFNYRPGHMFLITPQDCHSFDVEVTTEFFFLRFNDNYIRSKSFQSDDLLRLEYILQNANHQPGCILKNLSDKPLVRSLAGAVIAEFVNRDLYNRELVEKLVNTLIVIVARNIAKYLPAAVHEDTDARAVDILHYVQANLCTPEKLKAEHLSQQFGVSESYLGRYFKNKTQETLQQYISNLRLRHIESRLRFSDLRVHEIAAELGLADESHLNKFLRKTTGKSASQFRKEMQRVAQPVR
jgi:AraC-like DNA-binding protein